MRVQKVFTALIILTFSANLHAEILCIKDRVNVRNGRIKLAKNIKRLQASECPTGFTNLPVQDSRLVAFARLNGSGAVQNFGGASISGVSATVENTGDASYVVTFFGNFQGLTEDDAINRSLFTINSTAVADNYGVTNANIESVSSTELAVRVFLWKSDSLNGGAQAGIHLTVLQGQAPLT